MISNECLIEDLQAFTSIHFNFLIPDLEWQLNIAVFSLEKYFSNFFVFRNRNIYSSTLHSFSLSKSSVIHLSDISLINLLLVLVSSKQTEKTFHEMNLNALVEAESTIIGSYSLNEWSSMKFLLNKWIAKREREKLFIICTNFMLFYVQFTLPM
jgi:hypothetical protein